MRPPSISERLFVLAVCLAVWMTVLGELPRLFRWMLRGWRGVGE